MVGPQRNRAEGAPSRGGHLINARPSRVERGRDVTTAKTVTPPATASDHVASHVRAEILGGRLKPGSRLDQQALAEDIGVSAIPVREALRKLAAEGLVRIYPRRGAFVAAVSDEDLSEINSIRALLEAQAVRLSVTGMDEDRLNALRDLNQQMSDTARHPTPAWDDLNRQWHFTLYEGANSPLLLQLISILWDRYSLYRLMNVSSHDSVRKSIAEHEIVVQHIEAADADGAAQALRDHIARGAMDVMRTMKNRLPETS